MDRSWLRWKSLDLILRTMSDLAIHPTAEMIGEAGPLLSMTALQAAAGGGRKAIIEMNGMLRFRRTVSVKANPDFYSLRRGLIWGGFAAAKFFATRIGRGQTATPHAAAAPSGLTCWIIRWNCCRTESVAAGRAGGTAKRAKQIVPRGMIRSAGQARVACLGSTVVGVFSGYG